MNPGPGEKNIKDLPWPTLAILLTLVGGAIWVKPPLASLRPSGFAEPLHERKVNVTAEARLWQDPLEAARFHLAKHYADPDAYDHARRADAAMNALQSEVDQRIAAAKKVHVLFAMVSSGGGATSIETRRRTRQALVSALSTKGFTPAKGGSLDLLFVTEAEGGRWRESHNDDSEMTVPYEWFRHDWLGTSDRGTEEIRQANADEVLLIWVDESVTSGRTFQFAEDLTLRMLDTLDPPKQTGLAGALIYGSQLVSRWLRDELHGEKWVAGLFTSGKVAVTIIGPSNSGTLIGLLRNARPPEAGSIRKYFRMLSARSTASADLVWGTVGEARMQEILETPMPLELPVGTAGVVEASAPFELAENDYRGRERKARTDLAEAMSVLLAGRGAVHGRPFVSTIVRDDELADAMVAELPMRGLKWKVDDEDALHDCVGILGEWDSFYGRALPEVFKRAVSQAAPEIKDISDSVRTFHYLAGIDGRTSASVADPGGQVPELLAGGDAPDPSKTPDWPFGANRMDHLRRLTSNLEAWREELESSDRRLFAIGIMGGDSYDKQLILQALRPAFPDALFFSNDIDAQFMHPSMYHLTRNMVFASSYGLSLHADLQDEVPAFRDGYQTSSYLAGLLAVGTASGAKCGEDHITADNIHEHIGARTFEVSRKGAYPLAPPAEREAVAGRLHTSRMVSLPSPKKLLRWAVLAAVVLVLLIPFNMRLRSFLRALRHGRLRVHTVVVAGTIAVLVTGGYFVLSKAGPAVELEEPLSLQGISVWPTELLRFFAIVLSGVLFALAYHKMARNNIRMERKFTLSNPDDDERTAETVRADSFFGITMPKDMPWDSGVPIDEMWRSYRRQARPVPTLKRIAFVGSTFAILIWCIWGLVTIPRAPYRGDVARWVDQTLMIVAAVALAGLTFYVVDQIRLCTDLIRALASKRTRWPEAARAWAAKKFGTTGPVADEFLDNKFIGLRTKTVNHLIFYPFIVLAVVIVARNRFFDDWRWPLAISMMVGLLFVASALCAFTLRGAAERARRSSLKRLDSELQQALVADDTPRIELVRKIIDDIKNDKTGAFAPLGQLPVVQAILVPFGGLGTVALIDALSAAGF